MTTQHTGSHWNELLTLARKHMGNIGIGRSEWIWGGETVLMLRHRHRLSRDIDLFLNDPQLLSYLSPRLNDNVAAEVDGYFKQENHLRCFFEGIGEIDYLIAAPVIDFKSEKMDVPGHGLVQVMSDREILAQKMHYRAAHFTGRDLFDFAAITALQPELLDDIDLREIGFGRRNALGSRLSGDLLKSDYTTICLHDAVAMRISFDEARETMRNWLGSVTPSSKRPMLSSEGKGLSQPK